MTWEQIQFVGPCVGTILFLLWVLSQTGSSRGYNGENNRPYEPPDRDG